MDGSSVKPSEEDGDLELPFEKLNVSNESSGTIKRQDKILSSTISSSLNEPSPSESQNSCRKSIDDDLARSYCNKKKRKHRCKSVIRKAKLILPVELQSHKNTRNAKYSYENESEKELKVPSEEEVHTNITTPFIGSCGAQHINSYNTNNTGALLPDEQAQFNANELASYFEQMLYIPKPMSLMAEMMYA